MPTSQPEDSRVTTPRCVWDTDCTERVEAQLGIRICWNHALDVYWAIQPAGPTRQARHREPSSSHKKHGTIYYLRVGDRIKVGWTSNLNQRLRSYPPDSALLATEPGTLQDETAMHQRCTPFRVAGREWYEPGPGMDRVIEEAEQRNRLRRQLEAAAQIPRVMPHRPGYTPPNRDVTFTEGPDASEVKPPYRTPRVRHIPPGPLPRPSKR